MHEVLQGLLETACRAATACAMHMHGVQAAVTCGDRIEGDKHEEAGRLVALDPGQQVGRLQAQVDDEERQHQRAD